MEVLLLLLLAVAVVAVPICIVILLVGQSRLKARVAQLELGQLAAQTRVVAARADQRPLVEVTAKQPVMPVDAAPSGPLAEAEPGTKAPAGAQMEAPDAPVVAASRIPPPDQNRALVMRKDLVAALINWLARNWVYAISAMSLALAGVFLVQYGAERGLLSPAVRVVMAILLGAVLIGAGEWLRRRYGDSEAVATAFLPSVVSGAMSRGRRAMISPASSACGIARIASCAVSGRAAPRMASDAALPRTVMKPWLRACSTRSGSLSINTSGTPRSRHARTVSSPVPAGTTRRPST